MFNPLDFGAKGDGVANDTPAVRAAAAALAAAGGGTLYLPFGYTFLTGAFNLSSHAVLRVAGTLLASNASADFVLIPPLPWLGGGQDAPMSGQPEWSPVISAWDATNVTVTGGGVIDGNGAAWYACFADKLRSPPCNGFSRPQLLRPVRVEDFSLFNVTLRDSPAWTIHLAWTTRATLTNFTVTAPASQGNTDGVDVDCAVDTLVADFVYAGGDDAVAVKAGEDWFGWTFGRPTVNATIRRVSILSGNGYAIGSEESAGVHGVTFQDVTVNCTGSPLRCKHGTYIKAARGRGGAVTNVVIDRVTTVGTNEFGHGFTLDYTRPEPPPQNATATPSIANVTIANSVVRGGGVAFDFTGLPESVITGVRLVNVSVAPGVGNGDCSYVVGTCEGMATGCPKCFTSL